MNQVAQASRMLREAVGLQQELFFERRAFQIGRQLMDEYDVADIRPNQTLKRCRLFIDMEILLQYTREIRAKPCVESDVRFPKAAA